MNSKQPKSKSSESAVNAEAEWVVADEGEPSAEPRVEREPIDEPHLDIVQHAPDELAWTPVEPQDASDAADAPRVAKKTPRAAGAKPARVAGRARKDATDDVATEAAPSTSARESKRASKRGAAQSEAAEGTSTQDDAAKRKETLAEQRGSEVAPTATEPNAAGPLAKKRKLQKFVAERAEQRAREAADERAQERAADFGADRSAESAGERAADRSLERADEAPRTAPAPVAKRKRAKAATEQPATPPPVAEPQPPTPSEVGAVAPADAPTEPASTLPSMETYISELATMSVPQLVKRHIEVVGKKPKIKSRPWLVRKLGWFEQTKRYGGLSVAAKRRLEQLMSEIQLPIPTPRTAKSDAKPPKSADEMPLGVRLERKWHGRLIVATRTDSGWECEGHTFRSLSAVAKAVSGSHCSGRAFFGLWKARGDAR